MCPIDTNRNRTANRLSIFGLADRTVWRANLTHIDLVAYSLIFLLGALQFFLYLRAADVVFDATYADLARSLMEHGTYQFDFRPETLLPPGAAALLAAVWRWTGESQAVGLHVMAICSMLGLIFNYELLRRAQSRTVALVSCLLLGSSPALFRFATGILGSDLPYFCTSILTLLLIWKVDQSEGSRYRAVWIGLSALALAATILFRTAGVTIALGLAAWIAIAFLRSPQTGWRRLRLFWFPLALGLCVQLLWMAWASRGEAAEWPVPGYPHSYFSQLKVKNGNEPQLGMATLRDIPQRLEQNLDTYSVELAKLLTTKDWINPYWCSPFVAGVIALALIGLMSSFSAGGGQLHDWYFTLYATMILLWPWDFEARFLFPVVPLLCLYLCRGAKVLWRLRFRRPLAARIFSCLAVTPLILFSIRWAARTHLWQPLFAVGVWGLLLLVGAGLILSDRTEARGGSYLRVAVLIVVAALSVRGVARQLAVADWNLTFDLTQWLWNPYIDAADWIRVHEPPNAVVMARKSDLVFHYSNHRVVWFPPTTDARLLMQGIRKYHVLLLVVSDRDDGYWRPSPEDCFQPLVRDYPDAFRSIYHGRDYWIYQIRSSVSSTDEQRPSL